MYRTSPSFIKRTNLRHCVDSPNWINSQHLPRAILNQFTKPQRAVDPSSEASVQEVYISLLQTIETWRISNYGFILGCLCVACCRHITDKNRWPIQFIILDKWWENLLTQVEVANVRRLIMAFRLIDEFS